MRAPRRHRACLGRGGWLAGAACLAWLLGAAGPAMAQQTVVIGGGGPVATLGAGAKGVVVNDSVLDSLGPAPGGAGPAMGPASAPRTPVLRVPGQGAATAYRRPDTGELVVTRPSELLYPPLQFPKSRLTVAPPAGTRRVARQETPPDGAKLRSRLLVPAPAGPPPAPKATATAPAPKAPAPRTATKVAKAPVPAPAPAKPAPVVEAPPPPKLQVPKAPPAKSEPATVQPLAKAPPPAEIESAARPTLPPPPASALTGELKKQARAAPEPPATAPAPSQQAALPKAPGFQRIRLLFEGESADLSDDAKANLAALAARMTETQSTRVQLLAYARAAGAGSSRARRLSLSRALAVRAFLIDKGIRSTRMDVRALGGKSGDGPADRVDIVPQSRS